jgi:hypothetical protein
MNDQLKAVIDAAEKELADAEGANRARSRPSTNKLD